jgi:predicted dithiol-disulfide oxidoreductase (DUF899 family)
MPKQADAIADRPVVSRDEWIAARKRFLIKEKKFTKLRDELSRERRDLPWVRVEKGYTFEGPDGRETLPQLFAGRSQLVVYHFMFDPAWEAGCKSCSFWADSFERNVVHLNQRDVTLVAVSSAPLAKLEAFRERMGWTFKWVSCAGGDFNRDYHVSFAPEQLAGGEAEYNYEPRTGAMPELPGLSVFFQGPAGAVFHTYSCYARGLDAINAAYQILDLVPKGRDEAGLPYTMAWVRHRDSYGA